MTGARKVIVKEPILLEEEADRNAEGNDKSEFPYEQEALDNEGAPVKDENDDEPEFEGVRPGDDEVPEGDLQFDGDEPEAEPTAPDPGEWHPGSACLSCGARNYRVTTGNGTWCDQCDEPDED